MQDTEEYPDSKRRLNKGEKAMYQALEAVPAIISKDQFKVVAAEKDRRSNIVLLDGRLVRKATHYSMKKTNIELPNESEFEKESI